MSKTKLMIPVPALKTLDELEESNEASNRGTLEPNATVFIDSKGKRNSNSNTARSSSSIITIGNTTNIKQKFKPNQPLNKKLASIGRKGSKSDFSIEESTESSDLAKLESSAPPPPPKGSGPDYDKLVPSQCDSDLTQLKYINSYEKYLITRIFSSVANLSGYISSLNNSNLKCYLNTPDQNEFLPLYYAIKANNLTSVKYLVSIGASLNQTTSLGDPAPHLACLVGCSIEIVDYLLNCIESVKDVVVDKDLSKDESKSSLYKRDQEGWTVLHCACNQGNLNIVKYLVEKKFINVNVKDTRKNYTGLQLAIANNKIDVVEYLLSYESSSFAKKQYVETIFDNPKVERPIKSAIVKSQRSDSISTHSRLLDIPNELRENFTKRRPSTALSHSLIDLNKRKSISSDASKINFKKDKSNYSSSQRLSRPNSNMKRISNDVLNQIQEEASIVTTVKPAKPTRPKTCIEPVSFYPIVEVFKTEPVRYYNYQMVDLNSLNNDGHNVLHLACKYGRYEIVNILLRKYGSNSIDINMLDFKGKTCMDLAWNWLINIQNTEKNDTILPKSLTNKSAIYLYQEKMLNLNTKLDNEIQLISLLNQYGSKFSAYQILFYDLYITENYSDSNLNNLISNYLKCILYLFKLNLPTLFLNNSNLKKLNRNLNLKGNVTRLSVASSSDSMSNSSSFVIDSKNISNSNTNLMNMRPQTSESFFDCFKRDMKHNLNELSSFIQSRLDETSFEKSLFLENIQITFDYLSRF